MTDKNRLAGLAVARLTVARLTVVSVLVARGLAVAGLTAVSLTVAGLGASGADAPAMAADGGDLRYVTTEANFDDVRLEIEDAIVNRGMVVDYHGYLGNMLARTAEATGAGVPVYRNAEWYQFCSAALSLAMVEADPRNAAYCPYIIVVYELDASPGAIHVGYRMPPGAGSEDSVKALGAIAALLAEIVKDATE